MKSNGFCLKMFQQLSKLLKGQKFNSSYQIYLRMSKYYMQNARKSMCLIVMLKMFTIKHLIPESNTRTMKEKANNLWRLIEHSVWKINESRI